MNRRPPQPDGPGPADPPRDARLGAALAGLPVPEHGPAFWADLAGRLAGSADPTAAPGAAPGPATSPAPIPLDDRRARRSARRGRTSRSLGAAAAAVALVVAAAGAVTVISRDDGDSSVRTADRPPGTTQPGPAPATVPYEFSATYDGIEGWDGPDGCCSRWRLTVASDGSFRWTSADSGDDVAYDAATGRHVEIVTRGADASEQRPDAFVSAGVPAGGPGITTGTVDPAGERQEDAAGTTSPETCPTPCSSRRRSPAGSASTGPAP